MLLVRGFIGPTSNDATFHTFYVMNTNDVNYAKLVRRPCRGLRTWRRAILISLLFRDAGGNPIRPTTCLLFPGERDTTPQAGFVQFTPFNPLTRVVQLTYGGNVVAQRAVSANAPVIAITSLNVDSLNQNVSLAWNATDADGDLLFFTVQYSADNGVTWKTLKLDYLWQSVTLSSKMLHGSTTARLRVIASDGFNTSHGGQRSVHHSQPRAQITIQGVMPGERVPFGSTSELAGLALDAEDGSIGGASWSGN